jgi:hypothetical protein
VAAATNPGAAWSLMPRGLCLAGLCTAFPHLTGRDTVIVGSGQAIITLPMGTQITIEDALLYPDSTRTLLSYRDIHQNGFHIETHMDNQEEFFLLTKPNGYGKRSDKIPSLTSRLY